MKDLNCGVRSTQDTKMGMHKTACKKNKGFLIVKLEP